MGCVFFLFILEELDGAVTVVCWWLYSLGDGSQ